MTKKNIKITIVVIIVIIVIGALKFAFFMNYVPNYYSGVYLTTGEVYIGKLSHFPFWPMRMSDVYLVQTGAEEGSIDLLPLNTILWAPNKVELSEENVILFGRIGEDSPVAQALAEKKE